MTMKRATSRVPATHAVRAGAFGYGAAQSVPPHVR